MMQNVEPRVGSLASQVFAAGRSLGRPAGGGVARSLGVPVALALAFAAGSLVAPAAGAWAGVAPAVGGEVAEPAGVAADEFITRVNERFKAVQADRRSDKVVLPLLAKLEAPPAGFERAMTAALRPAKIRGEANPQFAPAEKWATAEPQKKLLESLKKVTDENERKKSWAFGQPYGNEGLAEIIDAGHQLYTQLDDLDTSETLNAARHKYLPLMEQWEVLVHVEASRLVADGKANEALELLTSWVLFSRQMAERSFVAEQRFALKSMLLGLQRLRDVAWVDSRAEKPVIKPEEFRTQITRLRDRGGLMDVNLMPMASADREGVAQLIERVFQPRGGPNEAVWAQTLSRATSKGRALRVFSETARWEALIPTHANQLETREQLRVVFGDWQARWDLPPLNRVQREPTDYSKMDRVKFAMLDAVLGDLADVFELRRTLRVELTGTRYALAMSGFVRQFNDQKESFPRNISSVRPDYIPANDYRNDNDPFKETPGPMEFYVPIRDTWRPQADQSRPESFPIEIFPGGGIEPFRTPLNDSMWVIYSVGPDGQAQRAVRATQMTRDDRGDYLIWPPVLSLVRQRLTETNRLP